MRAVFLRCLALTPALSRREREKNDTHYLATGSVYSPKGNLVTRQVGSLTQEAAEEIILHGNMAGY